MENFKKIGEITFLWGEDEKEGVKALNDAGFTLCIIDVDGPKSTWVIMKKYK